MKIKRKKIMSIICFVLSVVLFTNVIYFCYADSQVQIHNTLLDKIQIEIAEKKYNENPSTQNLFVLCSNLLHTTEFDLINKYYPKLFQTKNLENYITVYLSEINEGNNTELFLNTMLTCWLISEGVSESCTPTEIATILDYQKGYSFIEVIHISMLLYFEDNPSDLSIFLENLSECYDYVSEYQREEIDLIIKRYK